MYCVLEGSAQQSVVFTVFSKVQGSAVIWKERYKSQNLALNTINAKEVY